jgi:hypothetical protein
MIRISAIISLWGAVLLQTTSALAQASPPPAPRIVNIYNFIRNTDYRVPHSEDVLFEATRQELELTKQHHLPATWALQYDALINPKYQSLLKEQAGPHDEIAAWWEIPEPLARKAGIEWRGQHEWDSTANIGFSPGYTPDERRKLVDVYMADFKAIFGTYPRTVGSWYIDEVTLAYMADRYKIVASCNCKDQIGTDGYTLWGGYWNQAYYPSKLNAYMPAQNKSAQIDIPIFRMLGSDPIYQYARADKIYSLEPVYKWAGGSPEWVDWFLDSVRHQPCLAFGYTQAGQENSFGWSAINKGLTMQMEKLDQQAKAGEIHVETLADSGQWFHSTFSVTPPTAVVALDDWRHQDKKTVWYNSRFYRADFFWDKNGFCIRDLHRFDETIASPTHDTALKTRSLAYETLPIIEGGLWSTKKQRAGGFPVLTSGDGPGTALECDGNPTVKELNATDLSITQPLNSGGRLTAICRENSVTISAFDGQNHPLAWAFDLVGGAKQKSAVQGVDANAVHYSAGYSIRTATNAGSFRQLEDGTIRISPNAAGEMTVLLGGF